jgi:uncharacterized protein (DUF2062 family)
MIFRRRARRPLFRRIRDLVSPPKGWRRGFTYVGRRVQRLPDTPHRIAIGFACGVFASFTPFFTLHFVVAALCALAVRGNVLASALGTLVGNPLTFPLIAGSALTVGNWLVGSSIDPDRFNVGMVFRDLDRFLDRVFVPYLVGGVLPGLLAALAFYLALRPVVAAYQNRRRLKLMAVAKARQAAHMLRSEAAAARAAEAAE